MPRSRVKAKLPGLLRLLASAGGAVVSGFRRYRGGKPKRPHVAKRGKGKRQGVTKNDGDGNQQATFSHGRVPKKLSPVLEDKIRKALQPMNNFVIQYQSQQTSAEAQCSYYAYEFNNPADIQNILYNATSNALGGASPGKVGKLYIEDSSMELTIANMAVSTANLRVYRYVYRRDLPASVFASTTSLASTGFSYNSNSGILGTSVPGTLFMNPAFCSFVKILNTEDYQLQGGKVLRLSSMNKRPKVINPFLVSQITGVTPNMTSLGRYTEGVIIQLYGNPEDGVATNTTDTSLAKISVQQYNRYHFNQPTSALQYNFYTSTSPGTVVNPTIINPDSDAVLAVSAD